MAERIELPDNPDEWTFEGGPVGYLHDWKPYKKNEIMLGQSKSIIEDYRDNWPLTLRQIYYRMIGVYGHPKGKTFEKALYRMMAEARRAGDIPFEVIRDDGIMGGRYWVPDLPGHLRRVERVLRKYEPNRQLEQEISLEVWCEAGGMVPQLQRPCEEYSIPVYSCGGFGSVTAIHDIVDRIVACDRDTIVLHLGDYDPSGISIYERIVRDVQAFLEEDAPWLTFRGVRVALTAEQITEHNLPMDLITTKDRRSLVWKADGLLHKCELEALAPDAILALLIQQIENYTN